MTKEEAIERLKDHEEAIERIKDHMKVHRSAELRAIYITEALKMAIKALEQESCETQMIDKSNLSQEQYKADLQSAYDCGKASVKPCEDCMAYEDDMLNEGKDNTGMCNTGDCNTGYCNTGDRNTGNWNTGDRNTGYRNTGDWNTGNWNTGYRNTGDWNTGDWNTGYRNTGDWNTGDRNTGNWNTGYCNTGDRNTGDWNTGDCNTGDWNKTNNNTGCFMTEERTIEMFNKPSGMTYADWERSMARNILLYMPQNIVNIVWTDAENMSDAEKEAHPEFETIGGYLHEEEIKADVQSWWDGLSSNDKETVMSIPNFDADIFFECTGIRV